MYVIIFEALVILHVHEGGEGEGKGKGEEEDVALYEVGK